MITENIEPRVRWSEKQAQYAATILAGLLGTVGDFNRADVAWEYAHEIVELEKALRKTEGGQ